MYYIYAGQFRKDFHVVKTILDWQGIIFFTLNPNISLHNGFIKKYYKGNNMVILKTYRNEFLDLADESLMRTFYGVWPFIDYLRNETLLRN